MVARKASGYKKGYSVVELIVVITIITILVSIILVTVNAFRENARDTKRQDTLRQITQVFELYLSLEGRLPTQAECDGGGRIQVVNGVANFAPFSGACSVTTELSTFFLETVSQDIVDPLGADSEDFYFYFNAHDCGAPVGGTQFLIWTQMENQDNSNRDTVCPDSGSNNDGWYNFNGNTSEPHYPFAINLTSV
ncbi:MAG: prepilin-type N-terminal cleavage/methylation domain-containing protein [Patescibacteria group bacterium]